jgi:hypothetical protein
MYDTKNTTVQWSIVSEGLYNAGHAKGSRAYAGVWGGQYASYHHNLIAHQNSRTIRFNGARAHDTLAVVDYRNNVIYNWGNANAAYGGEVNIANGKSQVNVVNNYYKPGPATPAALWFFQPSYTAAAAKGTGQWYVAGNQMAGNSALTADNWAGVDLSRLPAADRAKARSGQPFTVKAKLPEQSATAAYAAVLAGAGAYKPKRDAVDARIVAETKAGKALGAGSSAKPGIIDSPAAVGGWPDYAAAAAPADTDHDGMPDAWEVKHGLNPRQPADRNEDWNDNGYTNLEEFLNGLTPGTGKTKTGVKAGRQKPR